MLLAAAAVILGLVILVWSANQFVLGSAATAHHFKLPALVIGMVIVGFGTSAPELVVSAFAAIEGRPGVALGNAYGSNICNIGLILGLTALISPITVQSRVLRTELPILILVTGLAAWQLRDGNITRVDAVVLLLVFAGLMAWTIRQAVTRKSDVLAGEVEQELQAHQMPLRRAIFWLVTGLILLIASSRLLVWGAVEIARSLGVDDLIIGLTIIAIGTSLPELASSILAARKGEHDIALGNVIGSNLFNTLAVVGLAGVIHPLEVGPEVLTRDALVMGVMTCSLVVFGYGFRRTGRLNRVEAGLLLAGYIAYTAYLVNTALRPAAA